MDTQTTSTTLDQTTSSPKEQLHSTTTPAQNTEQTEPSQDNLPPTKAEGSPEVSKTPSTTSVGKQAETPQNTQSEAPVSQTHQPTQAHSTNSEKNNLKKLKVNPQFQRLHNKLKPLRHKLNNQLKLKLNQNLVRLRNLLKFNKS